MNSNQQAITNDATWILSFKIFLPMGQVRSLSFINRQVKIMRIIWQLLNIASVTL